MNATFSHYAPQLFYCLSIIRNSLRYMPTSSALPPAPRLDSVYTRHHPRYLALSLLPVRKSPNAFIRIHQHKLEAVSKKWIRVQGKARGSEKAQHTRGV